jgi:hypothetical protein
MRKILSSLFAIIAVVASTYAAAPTAPTLYGPLSFSVDYAWNVLSETAPSKGLFYAPGTAKDSMVAADTINLLKKYPIESIGDYAIQIFDSTSTADSFKVEARVYGANGTNVTAWTILDTLGGGYVSKVIGVPFSTVGYGKYIDVRTIKWVGTVKAIIKRFEFINRKPIVVPGR